LTLFAARYAGENLNPLARAFDDFRALFEGAFQLLRLRHAVSRHQHSLDVTLAMAPSSMATSAPARRQTGLAHGVPCLGVLVALLHDAGT